MAIVTLVLILMSALVLLTAYITEYSLIIFCILKCEYRLNVGSIKIAEKLTKYWLQLGALFIVY